MVEIIKGELVLSESLISSKDFSYGIFITYGKNAAFQENKNLSKILLDSRIVQVPTTLLKKLTKEEK